MLQYNPQYLPTAEELPETDHAPVESQLQILIANLLEDPKLGSGVAHRLVLGHPIWGSTITLKNL